ncbi:carbapenam-3-carboxylate synthase domain-containing protein [Acerihabitans sp. KWT182]|uniref:Carbapenam-3-carboxylate synthase domain-containing protein n=1 Tax=Acerihabitans sp. KWT182 TaxID=3157919 RepID=A0AAU7Q865_9GAMM
MSNRFCIILNEGNKSLTMETPPNDKIYPLRQGILIIGERTPYKAFNINSESWHIIGHIDNLPLLNYLLYSHYPSQNDVISKEIICLAVKRYGMKIIELLQGNFCIIHEDPVGDLTVVTEGETQKDAAKAANDAMAERASDYTWPFGGADIPLRHSPLSFYGKAAGKECFRAVPVCQCPQPSYGKRRNIVITRWNDDRLQFIRSVSHSTCPDDEPSGSNEMKNKGIDIENYSLS